MTPSFLSKSTETREQQLIEAYKTMKLYRENLSLLNRIDQVMKPHEKMQVLNEIRSVDTWLKEKERIMVMIFEIHESDLIDL